MMRRIDKDDDAVMTVGVRKRCAKQEEDGVMMRRQ
jgi:hypothetical protein